ncbi:MAG: hypothetical protein MUO25_02185 [Thermoanaerobaculaceae bacterium]|nr:hypothetical protein [Thermoanaerobaculaceae bacterium]
MNRRRRGRSLAEYFMAAIGLAIIVFVVALIATPGSCRFRISPEVGIQPSAPRPTPVPTAQP